MHSKVEDDEGDCPCQQGISKLRIQPDRIPPRHIAADAAIGASVGGVILGALASALTGPVGIAIGAGVVIGGALGSGVGVAKLIHFELVMDHINRKRQVAWDKAHMCENMEKADKLSKGRNILEDNEQASTMVLSAKNDNWEKVFSILSSKPHIINAIPQERAWSVLHQAVYCGNHEAVKKLLAFPACDPEIRAKRDRDNHGGDGMTPLNLAIKHNRNSCERLLRDYLKKDSSALELTFISEPKGNEFLKKGIPYFDLATSFLKRNTLLELYFKCDKLHCATRELYQVVLDDWKYVRDAVTEYLYPFDKTVADRLEKAKSSYELRKAMICIYTHNSVYKQVNAALRRASETEFPVSDDLSLSLYILFLTSILLHWKKLESVQETLYRGIALPADQAKLYCKGTTFHWLSFTSSSRKRHTAAMFAKPRSGAVNAMFIIDNSQKSKWSPRDIKECSEFASEEEVVYPPCAKFYVTDVKDMSEYTVYNLKLLHPHK